MPYVSAAQRGYFNANRGKLEKQGVDVDEWNQSSKGLSLPEHSMSGNWMAGEAKREKHAGTRGVFKAAAQRAGKSTKEYAEEEKHASGKTGKRARLALSFMSAKH